MSTVANAPKAESGHWYKKDGTPCYTVIAKGSGLPRPTTLADARKLNLLPSVTGILRILHKEALVTWLCEQTALAVLTTPRLENEADDAFVHRVLHVERHQDQESQKARELGTDIHNAMEMALNGQQIDEALAPWVRPAIDALKPYGAVVATEKVLVGNGYAGKTDLITETPECFWIWDFKSAKKLPKTEAWSEHLLQASAYAMCWLGNTNGKPVRTGNLYISTVDCGSFKVCEHEEWKEAYMTGFKPLVEHWCWSNSYKP
jgi:hypothetical protein